MTSPRTTASALIVALAAVHAPRAAAGDNALRQKQGPDGVIELTNLPPTRCRPPYCSEWVGRDGHRHLTLRGPSSKAREVAAHEIVQARAATVASPVHETRRWDLEIAEAAEIYRIPHELVRAIIVAESNFDPGALSNKGAQGLMQLMPETAREMYVNDRTDPVQNIRGGTRYLRILANQFQGDLLRTVAAYNAGPEAVRRAGGIPAFAETREYVKRVMRFYRIYRGLPP